MLEKHRLVLDRGPVEIDLADLSVVIKATKERRKFPSHLLFQVFVELTETPQVALSYLQLRFHQKNVLHVYALLHRLKTFLGEELYGWLFSIRRGYVFFHK